MIDDPVESVQGILKAEEVEGFITLDILEF